MPTRCAWANGGPLEIEYHDTEWGVPSHDDRHLFEMLILEGAQAGLSWSTVLRKRQAYRKAFAGFDPAKVARFDSRRRAALMRDPGIVRNRLKIDASVTNARQVLAVQEEHGSLAAYLWQFVGGRPIVNRWTTRDRVPAETAESRALSRALLQRGFRFVGPTICYAFMQATGMVNDHVTTCFRYSTRRSRRT
ncbi:MAG TPA: DNA-3-methyladenine glycosylase I [Methylomirabilota bacterium]